MKCRRHVNAAGVVVGRLECDIRRFQIRAHPLQEGAQRNPGPATYIAPTLDTDMLDDNGALRKRLQILHRPWPFVLDQACELKSPGHSVDRLDIGHGVIGVELRRPENHGCRICRRKLVWIEQKGLNLVVQARNCQNRRLHGFWAFHIASCQHDKRAERKAAADQSSPFE